MRHLFPQMSPTALALRLAVELYCRIMLSARNSSAVEQTWDHRRSMQGMLTKRIPQETEEAPPKSTVARLPAALSQRATSHFKIKKASDNPPCAPLFGPTTIARIRYPESPKRCTVQLYPSSCEQQSMVWSGPRDSR